MPKERELNLFSFATPAAQISVWTSLLSIYDNGNLLYLKANCRMSNLSHMDCSYFIPVQTVPYTAYSIYPAVLTIPHDCRAL